MLDATRTLVPGSLEWWLARLGRRLDDRRVPMTKYEDYYAGQQPLAFASAKFRQAFGDRFPAFSSNFMALVVDAHRERLHVQGIRIGDAPEGDADAWRWWQANRLDAESQKAHTESLVKGVAYALVWPDPLTGAPEVTIESPLQVVVETEPGKSWKRRAALKRWLDDEGRYRAELYLPDGIYKFRSIQRSDWFSSPSWSSAALWQRDQPDGESWPVPNPLNVIPIVPIANRPRLTGDGQSEIAMVMSNQDAINKLRADALISSEFASFRQRWIIGMDIPVDPETGQPVEPFRSAVDRLWMVPPPDPDDPNPPKVEFGEFEQTDLAPIYAGIDTEVQHLGAISRTPYHYLLPQSGQPPSGESLKSSETGLMAKVADSMLNKGESWEEVFRLNFLFRGDPRANDTAAEIIWKDPESRTEAVHTDALVKHKSLGIPDEILWEGLGYSPQQIARIKRLIADAPPLQSAGPLPATLQPPAGADPGATAQSSPAST
jgi:hypothetical protein